LNYISSTANGDETWVIANNAPYNGGQQRHEPPVVYRRARPGFTEAEGGRLECLVEEFTTHCVAIIPELPTLHIVNVKGVPFNVNTRNSKLHTTPDPCQWTIMGDI